MSNVLEANLMSSSSSSNPPKLSSHSNWQSKQFIKGGNHYNLSKSYLSSAEVVKDGKDKMASGIVEVDFPIGSLVPKAETGVLNFLQKYPEFDGRDVTIAIFDSGTDPRAAGLQTNADGSVKVIERFDCSGCGDTNMTKKVTANSDGLITGLSGRSLKISNHMKESNVNGDEYRIGLKSFHDLYPSKIRDKILADEKRKNWDEPHKKATADVARELSTFELQDNSGLKEKLMKENLESSLEFLNNYEKKFNEIKTTYDCVLYRAEKCWYAVIDISENGDLENGVVVGEYSKTHEIKNIDDYMSVSMNVHDDGDVLEFVGMCSSHGTHVAAIASGNHSDKNLDGVAPNAKIVALTIGDGRLGSMETGTALIRAMIKVMELCNSGTKIDVINMSYGEHAHWSNSGRIGELTNEVVNKYGVVWVCSAGNHGPALCTIGTPPDISQPCIIGVGAYVSPQMMEAEYALREKLPANIYTWSSRDPCIDGGQGITVCAPGAAITSVPEYTMSAAQLMNGTSMASPHVAGAIALLISGLKKKGIKYSPYSIKRAISNTATILSYVDKFAQGNGLLNVDKAFEYLLQYANQPENLIRFRISCQNGKGIHIRRNCTLTKPIEVTCSIEPIFVNEKEVDAKEKINFNVRLNLICSEPWVKCGAFLDLCYSCRSIIVKIDPTALKPGVHTAKIKAYDTSSVEKGPLFEIPITVVQPHVLDVSKSSSIVNRTFSPSNIEFKPNTIKRDFILVPNNATMAVLKMITVGNSEHEKLVGKYLVHTMQLQPLRSCKTLETMKLLSVTTDNETIHAFKVEKNVVLELCIAKYWQSFGDAELRYSLEFHGISSIDPVIVHSSCSIVRVDLVSLGSEELSPQCQLKTASIVLKPSESKISPLTSRDVIPHGRQIYQNILQYNLHLTKSQELNISVPLLSQALYESEYESQFWMLFDTNKMLIASGDAYSYSNNFKLEKGDYVIRLQVRHEKKDLLEKISEANVYVTMKLQNSITVDIYDHYNQSIISGKKICVTSMSDGVPKCIYVGPLTNEKLSKSSIPSSAAWLSGTITYFKDETARKCDTHSFYYFLNDGHNMGSNNSNSGSSSAGNNSSSTNTNNTGGNNGISSSTSSSSASSKKQNNDASPKKSNKLKLEEYNDGLRDFKCSMIPKLDRKTAEELYEDLIKAYPKQSQIHLAFIQNLESNDVKSQYPFMFVNHLKSNNDENKSDTNSIINTTIIELADKAINEIDKDALLAFYGLKNDSRPDAAKIKTNMDKQKNLLLDCLVKKGINLCKLSVTADTKSKSTDLLEQIDTVYTEIVKFVDSSDTKAINFSIWHAYVNGHYGRMTKFLQKLYDEKLNKDILEEIRYIAAIKKWTHIENIIKRQIVSANPTAYRPF